MAAEAAGRLEAHPDQRPAARTRQRVVPNAGTPQPAAWVLANNLAVLPNTEWRAAGHLAKTFTDELGGRAFRICEISALPNRRHHSSGVGRVDVRHIAICSFALTVTDGGKVAERMYAHCSDRR